MNGEGMESDVLGRGQGGMQRRREKGVGQLRGEWEGWEMPPRAIKNTSKTKRERWSS
jgi:hypothetical protein